VTTRTTIEWTEQSWNPCTGCNKVSPGCQNCFAERITHFLSPREVSQNVWIGVTVLVDIQRITVSGQAAVAEATPVYDKK